MQYIIEIFFHSFLSIRIQIINYALYVSVFKISHIVFNFILRGWIKGYNSFITTIMFQEGNFIIGLGSYCCMLEYSVVVLLIHFIKETHLFIAILSIIIMH